MKKIIKKATQPTVLSDWKRDNPRKKYEHFQRTQEKKILHRELLSEQFFLCCYCGTSIETSNSHIEHIEPQNKDIKTLDYNNLLVSCNGDNIIESGEDELKYCGHRKSGNFDPEMLTPLADDCEERMALLANGHVKRVDIDDRGAKSAIEILGLNSYVLSQARFLILDSYLQEFIGKDALEEAIYIQEEVKYLGNVVDGKLPKFSQELSSFLINELLRV